MSNYRAPHAAALSVFVGLALAVAGCGPAPEPTPTALPPTPLPTSTPLPTASPTPPPTLTPTAVPPTATAEPPALFGTLLGLDGPMQQAEVTLTFYPGEACEKLATSADDLSEADQQQLTACSQALAPTRADEQGRYRITELTPGWYSLSLSWTLSQKPDQLGLMSMAFRNGFLTVLGESTDNPGTYVGIAVMNDPFYYSGTEAQQVDFDYNQPDTSTP